MDHFELISNNKPAGDQPKAIASLVSGLQRGMGEQTLLGATGTGKSVIARTPILIRDQYGTRMIEIGDLIDAALSEQIEEVVLQEETEILDTSGLGIFAWSFNPRNGDVGWKKITQFTRHEVRGSLYCLKTSCGAEVTVTGDHNFYAFHDGKLQLCKTTELGQKYFLPAPRILPNSDKDMAFFDLTDFLLESNRKYFVDVPRSFQNQKMLLSAISPHKSWAVMKKNERVPLVSYRALENAIGLEDHLVNVGGKLKKINAKLLQPITARFLRLIGYYLAEGHAEKQYLVFSSADQGIIDDFSEEARERGMTVHPRLGTYDYQCNSVLWADVFSQWCGSRSVEKRLPPFWFALSNRQLAEILRAYFSGDGGVERDMVSASTVSQKLASDIKYALLRFGIFARVKRRLVKIPNTSRRSVVWRITISGKCNIELYKQHVGFTIDRKNAALERIEISLSNTNVDIVPIEGSSLREIRIGMNLSQKDIAKAAGVSRSHISFLELGLRFPSTQVCRNLLEYLFEKAREQNNIEIMNRLEAIRWLPDFFWSPVSEIDEVPREKYVYDIAVADNETFLAGYGGLFVHNTFTIANVIQEVQRPTLVIAHNKTLAAQLANEFRELFPKNSVNYFVSYYDYYQPEAYIPSSDTFIDKEALINDEIDKLRHAATTALLTRKDVIVVASVSCIYGLGAPEVYRANIFHFKVGDRIERKEFSRKLVELQFTRTNADLKRATYRLRGENWEIMPADREVIYNFEVSGGVIRTIYEIDPVAGFIPGKTPTVADVIFAPAKHFITEAPARERAIKLIQEELKTQLKLFETEKKFLEAERLERRTKFDLAMMREVGYCHGIENYSRHLSGRAAGEPPDTLLNYFPHAADGKPEFLTVIDESHMTVPQLQGMFNGDAARKTTLIEYGFRLPSAKDNRPLRFQEFDVRIGQTIYVSATPSLYEREASSPENGGQIVEQIIRPTGLIDPKITIKPARGQVEDLIPRIEDRVKKKERVLVTTLTKRMAEDLSSYLEERGVKVNYLHSDVKTLDRIRILTDLRRGKIEVLVGVNLLREGLDLPEVSLVAILDADKEGFLRSEVSLIQTIGRAARNSEGEVLMYADKITGSIERAIKETDRRRTIQVAYNKEHHITPRTIQKAITDILPNVDAILALEAAPIPKSKTALEKLVKEKEREMKEASKHLDFELAAILRDEIKELTKKKNNF